MAKQKTDAPDLRRYECSLAHSPTLVVEAAHEHDARAIYLARCNVISTTNPVKVVEADGAV